jgi:hypothetical protein
MYTNRQLLEKDYFFGKNNFQLKNSKKNFFSNIGRFIYQNVQNKILRKF